MKVFLFILVCALIGCSITLTSGHEDSERACWRARGDPITRRCSVGYADSIVSECFNPCKTDLNAKRGGRCIMGGCCCFGGTNGFRYGKHRWQ